MIRGLGYYQGGYPEPVLKGITGGNSGFSEGFTALFQAEPTNKMTGAHAPAKDFSNFAISTKIMPLERHPINYPPVIAPMYCVTKPSFLKGMEDGVLSFTDLEASFAEILARFKAKLAQNKIDLSNLELMTDDQGELALLNNLPGGEKARILEIFDKDPQFKKLFNQMQFVMKLEQHPELFKEFTAAYGENPKEAVMNYDQFLNLKFDDGIFILGIQGNDYKITFKKVTIGDIQAKLDETIEKLKCMLKRILSDNQIEELGDEIQLQFDGKISLKLNCAEETKIENLLNQDQSIGTLLRKIEFLAGIIENPKTLPNYARSFLLGTYPPPKDLKPFLLTMESSKYNFEFIPNKALPDVSDEV